MAKPLGFSGFGVMHGQLIQWGSRIASVGQTGVEQAGGSRFEAGNFCRGWVKTRIILYLYRSL